MTGGIEVRLLGPLEVVVPDGTALPATAGQVEFYVPPFFPAQPAIAAIRELPKLAVVQALTAGVDRLRPEIPAGVTLCNRVGHPMSASTYFRPSSPALLWIASRSALRRASAARATSSCLVILAGSSALVSTWMGTLKPCPVRLAASSSNSGRGSMKKPLIGSVSRTGRKACANQMPPSDRTCLKGLGRPALARGPGAGERSDTARSGPHPAVEADSGIELLVAGERFTGNREAVRRASVQRALQLLLQFEKHG